MIPFLGASQENATLSENSEVANTIPPHSSDHESTVPHSPANQPFANANFYSPGRVFKSAINQLKEEGVKINYIHQALPSPTSETTKEKRVNVNSANQTSNIPNAGVVRAEDPFNDIDLSLAHKGVLNSPFVISYLFERLVVLLPRLNQLEEKQNND